MRLIIPKLEIDIPILDCTSESTLLQGEGLYDYAQLPQETGGNVSIDRPPQLGAKRPDHRRRALLLPAPARGGRYPPIWSMRT